METTIVGLVRILLPRVPRFLLTALQAPLGLSPNASDQDVLTELVTLIARPVLGTPSSLLQSQENTRRDYGVWGPLWIAKCTLPKPESQYRGNRSRLGIEQALIIAIEHLGNAPFDGRVPELVDVEAEWTGYRKGASYFARRPDIPEYEQYRKLMQEVNTNSPTILYLHGGAFCLMDPATHRITTTTLAKHSRGRCLSVRYRLSPQHMFPDALLDALVAYLSLLSPPPKSFHTAVPSSQIVLAGDSSGAGLASSLMLLLLTFRRLSITHLRFHGKDVDINGENCTTPPAAGLAVASPWLDVSRSLPSVYRNARWDIITSPLEDPSSPCPAFPKDSIWPASPPRVETYCEAAMVSHPLVSPLAASLEHWRGAPPTYICVGWESMQDESEVLARRLHDAGATVVLDGYEGMPHCFAVVPWNQKGFAALKNWGSFCRDPTIYNSTGTWTKNSGEITQVELSALGISHGRDLDDATVESLMARQRERRVVLESSMRERWRMES